MLFVFTDPSGKLPAGPLNVWFETDAKAMLE